MIVGGGFAGLQAARSLRRAPVAITLIDRENYHLFQPLLYQVATGGLSPADIAEPLRTIFKRQRNVRTLMGEAADVDVSRRELILKDGKLSYDTLIVATGASHNYFGHNNWERLAPGLKTVDDATRMRARILYAFEKAERESNPDRRRAWMTFVIVGGGPTGVELAGALAEIARDTLKLDFRSIDPAQTRVMILERGDRILKSYPPGLSAKAQSYLEKLGVVVQTGCTVTDIRADEVSIKIDETEKSIGTHSVLWAAGVRASSLGGKIAGATGVGVDECGKPIVGADLTIPGHPEIFVIGDLAHSVDKSGAALPGVAQVALQQGRYVAGVIQDRLKDKSSEPFRYRDYGSLATVGRATAIADFGWIRFSGFLAWALWLFLHLMRIVGYENRALVFVQWAVNYVSYNRSARLITGRTLIEELNGRLKRE